MIYFTYLIPSAALCGLVWLLLRHTNLNAKLLSYSLFAVAPLLTLTGSISPLTGFAGGKSAPWLYGITFLTPFLALLVFIHGKALTQNTARFFAISLNPIYLLSGPIPTNLKFHKATSWRMLQRRLIVQQRYAILGMFFLFVAAPGFKKLLLLKSSTAALDTLLFGLFFEFYVYFNFAGYSLIAYALMKTLGINAPLNFKQPFSSRTVVEYWQRWHASLGNVLRNLFFNPVKQRYGPWLGVWATFIASAAWHGTTFNFLLWGAFQASMWCISRWLFLKRAPIVIQYILLVFAIAIGRVLFSEADQSALLTKLTNLCIPLEYLHNSILSSLQTLSNIDKARLALASIYIAYEVAVGQPSDKQKHYKLARHPMVSACILLSTILLSGGEIAGAVYGAR